MIGGRFKATRVDSSSAATASVSKLTGLFKTQMASIPAPPVDFRPIRATSSTATQITPAENPSENLEKTDLPKEGIEDKEDI